MQIVTIAVSLIIALVAIWGGIVNENYKTFRKSATTAAIIHADISALISISEDNKSLDEWSNIKDRLETGHDVVIPKLYFPKPDEGSIFLGMIQNIGLLSPNYAKYIIKFYMYLVGVRMILTGLSSGELNGSPLDSTMKLSLVKQGINYWQQCRDIAAELLPNLEATSSRRFCKIIR